MAVKFSKLWQFVYLSGREEAFWSAIKFLVFQKFGLAAMLSGFTTWLAWEKIDWWLLFVVGVFVFLAGIWIVNGFVFGLFTSWKKKESVQVSSGIEIYKSRLEAPLEHLFSGVSSMWCVFRTGSGIRDTDFFDRWPVRQAVVMDPYGEYIKVHRTYRNIETLRTEIEEMLKGVERTKKNSVQMFVYDGAIPNSMILGNPESPRDGIIQVELFYPDSRINNRPIVVVRQAANPSLYELFKNMYVAILNKSTPAPRYVS